MFTGGTRRKAAAVAAALIAVSLSAAACGKSSSSAGSANVLKLWHYESADSAMGVAWTQAIKEFEQSHPGVKVQFEEKTFEQLQKTAPMVLNSSDAPDILEYNKGNATAGLLAKQGLLTDLTPAVAKYGWDKKITGNLATTSRYADGVMGSGDWYGIPDYAEFGMVYYNKDMFAKYGVQVPTTFEEFTAALDTFAKAGITPLASAGAEYPAQQYLYNLALGKADQNWVNQYEIAGKANFHDAAWTYGANTLADWVKKGYIAKDSVSQKATDMGTAFESGKSPMMVSGSWWYGTFESEVKNFAWDAFLWPGNSLVPGSGGNLWVIPKNSKKAQLAEDFIDITLHPDIQALLANKGAVPVAAQASDITDPKAKDLVQKFQALRASNGLAYYPDWPVPGFYDALVSATQDITTGKSVDGALGSLQSAYDQGLAH
ncbi:MAG: ABC transporter substrate-binding protein [Catenulispora sp.]